ncbi:helix-turn-helix domain-containing protein [Turicimonas muris]
MQMRRAFRFELCPKCAQARFDEPICAGSVRYVYNRTLAAESHLRKR